jgi:sialidase-1
MRRALSFATVLGLCPFSLVAHADVAGILATSSQKVHPVLIRNDRNPVVQVVVESSTSAAVEVAAVTFSLAGSTPLADIDTLTLFACGGAAEFVPTHVFDEVIAPATTVAFHGRAPLQAGRNVFWLSVKLKPSADLSGRFAAACMEITTSLGVVTPQDMTPGRDHRVGIALRKAREDGVHTCRIPTLATSAAGTLLCVYDMRRRAARDLQEDIDIGLSRSGDGGQTWESPRVIMDMGTYDGLPQEQNGCSDPGMVVDHQTGEIFCFAVWMYGKPGKHQWTDDGSEPGYEIGKSAQFMLVRSQDDGRTWSEPENLTRRLKPAEWWLLAPSPQQGVQLADGTLVMPCQGRDAAGVPLAALLISRDHGSTWTVSQPAYSGGNECQAAVLGDGSIMLNMRNDHERFRAVYVTRDLGQTWEPHATNRNTLIEPNCNGSLCRCDYVRNGEAGHVLLFANPHSQETRTHHTIQVSFDDGRTWPESFHRLLDESPGSGYASLTVIDHSHVGIVYEGSQAQLVFERFSLDELLAPRDPISGHHGRRRLPADDAD